MTRPCPPTQNAFQQPVLGGGGLESVIQVTIDIKPGSDPNSINLSSAGVVPVAILSTADFDATTVDPDSLFLSGANVKMAGKIGNFLSHNEDVNGDGLLDRVKNEGGLARLPVRHPLGALDGGLTGDCSGNSSILGSRCSKADSCHFDARN